MDVEKLLRKTLKPALGCTEPIAVALGVAAAMRAITRVKAAAEDVLSIRILVNRNVFKNAFSIYIPNAGGEKGILMAAALGAWCDPGAGLELFRDLRQEDVARARSLVCEGRVQVDIVSAPHTDLFIRAQVRIRTVTGIHEAVSTIEDEHTRIVSVLCDGTEVFRLAPSREGNGASCGEDDSDELAALNFADLVRLADGIPDSLHPLLWQTIDLNLEASRAGLQQPLGLGIGYFAARAERTAESRPDIAGEAAAGSDARMSGYPVTVMSSAGSGNQGMMATIPVLQYCRENGVGDHDLLRAVALSHLITFYISTHLGYLSTLCGVAVKAGIGAACGIVYAMGGRAPEVRRAVNIVAAALSGVICDGAKPGCALKVSSSADTAVRAASLAMQTVDVPEDNGIVGRTAENTIGNLARLNESMSAVEDSILQIMQEKIGSASRAMKEPS